MGATVDSTYFGDLGTFGFGMFCIGPTDKVTEILVELFAAVSCDGAANSPDEGEKEEPLQPQSDLKQKTQFLHSGK